ncbi:hypothetical protein N7488_001552 [Penicillium malachiteum]|nr:hypothetical protein N7488_001552 [Penicillium malachiteum]
MALLIAGFSLLAAAQAAKLTSVVVPGGCYNLPDYESAGPVNAGFAGPWVVYVDQCVNTTTPDNACSTEGFGSQAVAWEQEEGNTILERGYIGIVRENDMAKSPLRCMDGIGFQAFVPVGDSAEYRAVNITDMPYSAELMWNLGSYSEPIQAYHHYLDGVKQDGIFLGSHNVTTWGISLQEAMAGSGGEPWWMIRLLGPESADPLTGNALEDGEYRTFIRIDGS